MTYDSSDPIEIAAGQSHTVLPCTEERNGMTFSGWKVIDVHLSSGITGRVKLESQWTPQQYSIVYELNGGTNGANPDTYTYGTGVTGFADAAKEGYSFGGWYADSTLQTPVTTISSEQYGNITLYAKFDPQYTRIGPGTHFLTAGVMYKLDSGVTRLNSDSNVYVSGSIFYVPANGSYTFS